MAPISTQTDRLLRLSVQHYVQHAYELLSIGGAHSGRSKHGVALLAEEPHRPLEHGLVEDNAKVVVAFLKGILGNYG